ncbi:unnamed protein product [Acanthoscelides obtectus]|uniref:Uncharacterized protein n=1 Tax=Acanthoscelides obtectus TaxID=200917 RepID=A0A9P0KVG3_ACAOB|nr:unnamed protein product [Acanthoscelides obtectus]CAK1676108.1 hypothetical protein AOBTE_LOCUS30590 [Acanthoscelides obtectus]
MDWGDHRGGCFLYCSLQKPCEGGYCKSRSPCNTTGGAPCASPSIIGAIHTCRDVFDKLCMAADKSCSCCRAKPRECCCCCREMQQTRCHGQRSVCICDEVSEDEKSVRKNKSKSAATSVMSVRQNERDGKHVQKNRPKSTATSAMSLMQNEIVSDLAQIAVEFVKQQEHPTSETESHYYNEGLNNACIANTEAYVNENGGFEAELAPETDPISAEPEQSKAIIRRAPYKRKKGKTKCRCKNKKKAGAEKLTSLCQCPPVVIFDSPPAKRNFFDFLKCLMPRSKLSAGPSENDTPTHGKKKLLCACGEETQPFFGYAELKKKRNDDTNATNNSSKIDRKSTRGSTSADEGQVSSKKLDAYSEKNQPLVSTECDCAEEKLQKNCSLKKKDNGDKKAKTRPSERNSESTRGPTSPDEGQRSSRRLSTRSEKNQQLVLTECGCAEEDFQKNHSQFYRRLSSEGKSIKSSENKNQSDALTVKEIASSHINSSRKSSLQSSVRDGERRFPLKWHHGKEHGKDTERTNIPQKREHNRTSFKNGGSSRNYQAAIPEAPLNDASTSMKPPSMDDYFRSFESSKNNLIEHRAMAGTNTGEKNVKVTSAIVEHFIASKIYPMSGATYIHYFHDEFRRYELLFRERRLHVGQKTCPTVQTWMFRTYENNTKNITSNNEDTYAQSYDLHAIFKLFEEYKKEQSEYREKERAVLCRGLRKELSALLYDQRRKHDLGGRFLILQLSAPPPSP